MKKNNNPYPYNLLHDVFVYDEQRAEQVRTLDADQEKGLEYALSTLTDRESDVICEYYLNDKTLEETGKKYNVTKERIRQVIAKALRKLHHPSRSDYVVQGYTIASGELENRVTNRHKEELDRLESVITQRIESMNRMIDNDNIDANAIRPLPIEKMDFSSRTFHCLKRWGIETMYELCDMTESDLRRVRNLGQKSIQEIIRKMAEYGLKLKEEST